MKRLLLVVCCIIVPCIVTAQTDTIVVKKHLTMITKTEGFRNYENIPLLNKTAAYIHSCFKKYADEVYYQPYDVEGKIYKNVVCRFGTSIDKPVAVIGAHYDVCGDQEGADDNASGVVALLELARMLHGKTLARPVELVAYTLEEPPYFRTPHMGSNIHALSLKEANTPVYGMVAIEMIGYFDDGKNSQDYPFKVMKLAYGTRGNFILQVKRSGHGEFVKNFSSQFDNADVDINRRSIKTPAMIEGMDFSDHMNYWNAGYDAMMITNSAFYRNKNYHETTDKMETLDIKRMSKVIDAIFYAVVNLDNLPEKPMKGIGKIFKKKKAD